MQQLRPLSSTLFAVAAIGCGHPAPAAIDGAPVVADAALDGSTPDAAIPIRNMDLFYTQQDSSSTSNLHGYDFETATDTTITPALRFWWSPNRTTMLLSQSPKLSLFKLADRSSIDLDIHEGYGATWSPDSQHILLNTTQSAWVVVDLDGQKHPLQNPDGGTSISLAEFTTKNTLHLHHNQRDWTCAADGTQCIAAGLGCTISPDGTTEACTLTPKGIAFSQLSNHAVIGTWTDGDGGWWAPDGSRFASMANRSASGTYDVWGGTPTTGLKQFTVTPLANSAVNFPYPPWSPDSKRFAIVDDTNNAENFTIQSFDGLIEQSFALPERGYPVWSSDSRWIFFGYQNHAPELVDLYNGTKTSLSGLDPATGPIAGFSKSSNRFVYQTQYQTFYCSTATALCKSFGASTGIGGVQWRSDDSSVMTVNGKLHLVLPDGSIDAQLSSGNVQTFELR